jgi:hypothetical protein
MTAISTRQSPSNITDNNADGPSLDYSSKSDSDVESETSTAIYEQEPFNTYQNRVQNLLASLFGENAAEIAAITRLEGGSYNRIIGIVIPSSTNAVSASKEDLILRIPRFANSNHVAQVELLQSLRGFLPVPEVTHYDNGVDNALGQPYMLMRRIPGNCLSKVLQDMKLEERRDIARQVANLIAQFHSIPMPSGIGPLCADEKGELSVLRFPPRALAPWDTNNPEVSSLSQFGLPPKTFHDFVFQRLNEFSTLARKEQPPDTFISDACDRLLLASQPLLRTVDTDIRTAIFHRDFYERNILVARTSSGWTITGVIDWDECEAAPLEIVRVWPGWLWASRDEGEADFEENEWDPDLSVPDGECQEIKQAFVDEIERLQPGFLVMVRHTRDACLRPLYERARGGFFSNEHIRDIDRVEEAARRFSDLELEVE